MAQLSINDDVDPISKSVLLRNVDGYFVVDNAVACATAWHKLLAHKCRRFLDFEALLLALHLLIKLLTPRE